MPARRMRSQGFVNGLAAIALALLTPSLARSVAQAQAVGADRPFEGLDVVLLVDVSRSMYTDSAHNDRTQDKADGNDPQRLRWNAVQLVLNMLSAEDKVMIIPFNDQAPAEFQGRRVPGDLSLPPMKPPPFLPMGDRRGDYRGWVRGIVEGFMQEGDGKTLPNIDVGGTRILHALRQAAEFAKAEHPAPGRRLVAILLTDGRDDPDQKDFPRAEEKAALISYLMPWSERTRKPTTPVFTIGMGSTEKLNNKIDPEFLQRIAYVTGGDFTLIQGNDQIISTFRDLIWQLKGAWIKTVQKMDEEGATEDTMHGITELGVLAYSVPGRTLPDGRPDPRNTDPPQTLPSMKWSGADPPPVPLEDFGGRPDQLNVREGYLYRYFGRRYPDERSPFQAYASLPLKLTTSWPAQAVPHFLHFAKRTARPLFEVIEPVDAQSLPRHQPLAVRLRLADNENFRAEQFRLSVRFTTQESQAGGRPANRQEDWGKAELEPQPGSREYVGKIPLELLPQGKGDQDFFTIRLIAEGLPVGDNALSHYRLELPPRTIAVDNSVVLEPLDRRLVLTESKTQERVALRTRARSSGELAIGAAFTPVGLNRRMPVPAGAVSIRPVGPGGDRRSFRLLDGAGELDIVLDPTLVKPGVDYDDLELRLTTLDGSRRRLMAIPVELRISLSELSTDPPACRVEAGQKSGPITVIAREGVPPPNPRVRVTLNLKEGKRPLTPSELWLESAEAGTAGARRSQELLVRVGQAFHVRFEPTREQASQGQYLYEWNMDAPPWAKSSKGALTLDYKAARLVVVAPEPVQMGQGPKRDVAVTVRLEGLDGESCRLQFRPTRAGPTRDSFQYQSGPLRGQLTSAIRLDPAPAGQGPLITVGADRRPGETALHLGLTLAENAGGPPVGEYSIEGVIASESGGVRESEPFRLVAIVNTLEILEPPEKEGGEWLPLRGPVDFSTFRQREEVRTFRVKTGLGDSLQPGKLGVQLIDTLINDDGDRVFEEPELIGVEAVKGDPTQLELSIKFPGVGNPSLGKGYHFKVELSYDELAPRRTLEFRVKYSSTKIGRGG